MKTINKSSVHSFLNFELLLFEESPVLSNRVYMHLCSIRTEAGEEEEIISASMCKKGHVNTHIFPGMNGKSEAADVNVVFLSATGKVSPREL